MRSSKEPTSAKTGPRADQGSYGTVAHAVRQVGSDRGHDANAEAPAGQPWYTLVPPACVEHHHGRSPDELVHGEWLQAGDHARFAVRAYESVGVLVRDDRGDGGDRDHCGGGRDLDDSASHSPAPRARR